MSSVWFSWWTDADWVVRGVFVLLLAMSVASWATILHKAFQLGRYREVESRLAKALDEGQADGRLKTHTGPSRDAIGLLAQGLRGEVLDSRLAHHLREQRVNLESGFVVLASIANTAPFVGLLGTVWGIMHALQGLGESSSLTLAMVGGPVAEALVATAAGLFAAIPAVIGYNLLLRRLARLMVMLEGNAQRLAALPTASPAALVALHSGEAA